MDQNKVCPNCGRQNVAEAQWCAGCGINIATVQVSQGQGWSSDHHMPAQDTSQGAQSQDKQQIASSIQMRGTSDKLMPSYLALLPVIGLFALIILSTFYNLIGLGLGVLIFGALFAVFVNMQIKRQNEHMKREVVLRTAIISLVRNKAREQYKEQQVSGQIATMESINQEASYKEQENNVLMFTVMAFIPLLNIYPLYIITKNPYEHDQRWHAFTQQVQSVGSFLGFNLTTPSWKVVPHRSFLLYFIISIILALISTIIFAPFLFYWIYVMIKDSNEHFKAQWLFEDQLMGSL